MFSFSSVVILYRGAYHEKRGEAEKHSQKHQHTRPSLPGRLLTRGAARVIESGDSREIRRPAESESTDDPTQQGRKRSRIRTRDSLLIAVNRSRRY